jgi:hypothetical protein
VNFLLHSGHLDWSLNILTRVGPDGQLAQFETFMLRYPRRD